MKDRIQAIVALYNIEVASVELITHGFLSENYRVVAAQGTFFLKQYRSALDAARVSDIHKSKNFFAAAGIPAVLPIVNSRGETFTEFDGKFYALFPFITGRTFPDQHCSAAELRALAQMLARVHLAGEVAVPGHIEKKFARVNFADAISYADKMIVIIEADCAANPTEFNRAALRIAKSKRDLLAHWPFASSPLLQNILVHYDLHAGNVFFDDAGAVKAVFDFELTQFEPAAFDVVRTMTITCFDYGTAPEKWARAWDFLAAYRAVRPMSDEEFRAGVLEFVIYRTKSFWVEEEHYLKGSTRVDRFLEWDDLARAMWIQWYNNNL